MKNIKDYFNQILNENTFVLDEVLLNKYFDEFNKKYFDNKLNKPELVIIDNKMFHLLVIIHLLSIQ